MVMNDFPWTEVNELVNSNVDAIADLMAMTGHTINSFRALA
jgi:hypothetical protein